MKIKTVGEYAQELKQKQPDTIDTVELQREIDQKEKTLEEIWKCVEEHEKLWNFPFYVVVLQKHEKALQNVVRRYFLARRSCPSPTYDQTVFRFEPKTGQLEWIWSLPDRNSCKHYIKNHQQIPKSHHDLLRCIVAFYNGQLIEKVQKLNKEIVAS